jgi:squalene-hopene/tetraprenyl-beta-curcumene cyclase
MDLKRQFQPRDLASQLDATLEKATALFKRHQFAEGYWWYTLEANESIAAEYIFLTEYLGCPEFKINQAICRRILTQQRRDGSWAIYHGGPGELGATIECYWALKYCGYPLDHPALEMAREFILKNGGPTKARVFTKIHMALFGLAPWEAAPAMPWALIMAPHWSPINIYEFSSWARACVVPLLVVLNEKPVHRLDMDLEELYPEPSEKRKWKFVQKKDGEGLENIFLITDKLLKKINKLGDKIPGQKFLKGTALKSCERYIREHIEKTEDIFPALSYGAIALKTLGYNLSDPIIRKALKSLQSFQQPTGEALPHIPAPVDRAHPPALIHQQCCISPIWDTAWVAVSLVESGEDPHQDYLKKTVQWLLDKQIRGTLGDWSIKNKKGKPGGWAFEFENDYFPDVDDTIEVLTLLYRYGLDQPKVRESFKLGLDWLLSMQSKNGGWAAFDVDNTRQLVNHIPFSDHGACLDPPTADITGRMLEFLAMVGYPKDHPIVQKSLAFIYKVQHQNGAWDGRWGVNYLYGTWCTLQGLMAIGEDPKNPAIVKATEWLLSQQNGDGGWGESCDGYLKNEYVHLEESVPSQTAWALMGLIAVGLVDSEEVTRGVEYLLDRQNDHGCWDEEEFSGTGFPGHFYIRYHGYRHYFPHMALAKYRKALRNTLPSEEDDTITSLVS